MTEWAEIIQSLDKADILLEQLDSNIEERNSLIHSLNLTPSENDNYDLTNLLNRIIKLFIYIENGLTKRTSNIEHNEDFITRFKKSISNYSNSLQKLESDEDIDIADYRFKATFAGEPKETNKSVRFREDLVEYDEGVGNQNMPAFAPYKDNVSETSSLDNVTNQQIFAQHQQTLLDQDDNLDILHKSIQVQHSMGLNINRELDDHIILLNDLEQGVGDSQYRINSATNRLNTFRKKVKENGNLTTIIVLVVILILLLVVLN